MHVCDLTYWWYMYVTMLFPILLLLGVSIASKYSSIKCKLKIRRVRKHLIEIGASDDDATATR